MVHAPQGPSRSRAGDLVRCVRRIVDSGRFKLFPFAPVAALFRLDGLTVSVSTPLATCYQLVETKQSDDAIISELLAAFDPETLDGCCSETEEFINNRRLFSKLPELSWEYVLPAEPSGIVIMASQRCNLACSYCYGGDGSYGAERRTMKIGTAQDAIKLLLSRSPSRRKLHVVFFGGEPLLGFGVVRSVVDACNKLEKQRGYQFSYSLTTNATLLDEHRLEFLKRNRFSVLVSFDCTQWLQDSYRRFRDGSKTYNTAVSALRRMKDKGMKVHVRGTVVREAVERAMVEEMVSSAEDLGCDSLVLSPVDCSRRHSPQLALRKGDIARLGTTFERITQHRYDSLLSGKIQRIVFDPNRTFLRGLIRGAAHRAAGCGAFLGMTTVSTDGVLFPCHRFCGMGGYALGDLEGGLDTQRAHALLENATRAFAPSCSRCWARLICGGPCFYTAADGEGGFRSPDGEVCDARKQAFRSSIRRMIQLHAMPKRSRARYLAALRM